MAPTSDTNEFICSTTTTTTMDPAWLRGVLQHVIANDLQIPVDYLRRAWSGPYDPARHLFSHDERGRPTCVWMLDVDTWESVGDAYCRWMLVADDRGRGHFWSLMKDLVWRTPEWSPADETFKTWLERRGDLFHRTQ